MTLYLDGKAIDLCEGASYLDAVKQLYPESALSVLGVQVEGRTLSLNTPVLRNLPADSLTLKTEEGRRIYERSLRFVLLMAFENLYPQAKVRIENSTQLGLYLTVSGVTMTAHIARLIQEEMKRLVQADLPYEKIHLSRREAMELFRTKDQMDKVRLLSYRPYEHFQLYQAGDIQEYFYGEMAPSTGYTPVFAVRFHLPGLELQLPDPDDPSRPAPFRQSPKLMATFAQTTQWGRILGCDTLADLNEMMAKGSLREFIRVNEALHEKSISDVADAFVKSGAQLILIAGPSSSGKTTFSHRLSIQLKVRGLRPMKLSLDDYYLNRSDIPLEADGKPDLEKIETLDLPLFNKQLVHLLQGEEIQAPIFDFNTGKRAPQTHTLRLEPGQPVIVEGIHALNERLTQDVARDVKFLIYISALTTMNLDDHNRVRTTDVRLLRRIVRDHQFRGTPPIRTMDMWESVRRGEQNYIFPYQEQADVMFNSTLIYELAVLKKYGYPLLAPVPPENPYYTLAQRLLKFLNYVQCAQVEDEIPPNSVLREFIGGCCFYREED